MTDQHEEHEERDEPAGEPAAEPAPEDPIAGMVDRLQDPEETATPALGWSPGRLAEVEDELERRDRGERSDAEWRALEEAHRARRDGDRADELAWRESAARIRAGRVLADEEQLASRPSALPGGGKVEKQQPPTFGEQLSEYARDSLRAKRGGRSG